MENNAKIIDVKINQKISDFIDMHFKEDVTYFEKKNKIKIIINPVNDINLNEYSMDFKSKSRKVLEKIEEHEYLKKDIQLKKEKKINIKKKILKKNQTKPLFVVDREPNKLGFILPER